MKGQVVRVISGFYDIKEKITKKQYRVRGSGNLRNKEENPLVGDWVEFEIDGFLTKIYERKNWFIRPKIANIDQAIIVMSIKQPEFSSLLLDKFLAIIEYKNIKPIILLTKIDLEENYLEIIKPYLDMGYEFYFINNKEIDINKIKELKQIFKDKVSVFMGQTGVGKTSTINMLSNNNFATQEISHALNRGKHTTRVVQIIEWNEGQLIDTPGFSSFELDIPKEDISKSFYIFREAAQLCKFRSCYHWNEQEKDCKVKQLVLENKISKSRYENYLYLLKESNGEKIY